jgi:hypothetical protein
VIGKPAKPGEKTIGLLHYLYRLNSHHKDPHVIGGFQSATVLEPPLKPNGKPDLQKLAHVLEAPLALADTSGLKDGSKLVYHFCFRADRWSPSARAGWRRSRALSSASCLLRSRAAASLARSDASVARWAAGTAPTEPTPLLFCRSLRIWLLMSGWV